MRYNLSSLKVLLVTVALLSSFSLVARADGMPYAAIDAVNIYHILPAFPSTSSAAGAADIVGVFSWQAKPGSVEWQEASDDAAVTDSASLLNFFTAGILDNYTADNAPAILKLLDRVRASVDKPVVAAKQSFNRPRPFRALKLANTPCDPNFTPQTGPEVGMHDSYPSGHAAQGWAAALVLVMIAPDNAGDWLARGQEFGESRVACGVHYPSDVAAGRLLGLAAINALQADPDFKIDLGIAQLEYQRLRQLN